jgi:RND family efflux transporter MFP subunit
MEQDDEQAIEHPRECHERNRFTRAARGALIGIALVALGVAAGVWAERRVSGGGAQSAGTGSVRAPAGLPSPAAPPATSPTPVSPAATADVEVVLTPEGLARAGLKTATVGTGEAATSVRVPGSVMANAYREVKVTPIVGGIVRRVDVALGDAVHRGAPVVTLFSAELAEAQTKYLSMVAMFEADHKKFDRTQQLVAIGAASRQELEEVTAIHEGHATEVESARQRLLLLGLQPEQALRNATQVISTVVVPAPIDGVITGRTVNLGQVVSLGQELLIVTDLSDVWVVGDLYEQDFQAVQVGSETAITAPAYPGLTLRGRVTYIDPRVDAQTRTAKVRVEVPNPGERLRLGMYVSMIFTTRASERVIVVPRSAVQSIGERSAVYLPVKDEEGKFVQRQIRLGQLMGDAYTVLGGLRPGEIVVTEGSFFLRAESLRNAPG